MTDKRGSEEEPECAVIEKLANIAGRSPPTARVACRVEVKSFKFSLMGSWIRGLWGGRDIETQGGSGGGPPRCPGEDRGVKNDGCGGRGSCEAQAGWNRILD